SKRWIRVFLFYVLALSTSLPTLGLRSAWFYEADLSFEWSTGKAVLIALGPFLAALLFRTFLSTDAKSSLTGGQPARSFLMLALPIVLFTIIGVEGFPEQSKYWTGFWLSTILILYALFEEFGWRGYLEEEVLEYPPLVRYMIVGTFWYAWHWTFLDASSWISELLFWGILVGASWGIGQIRVITKSLMACAAFHIIGNVFFRYYLIVEGVPQTTRFILLAICLIVWILLLRTWPTGTKEA
ncbi:MAG: CPBP family glutamic-type intramembrane protease, partial [Bacteroidota bacterium]